MVQNRPRSLTIESRGMTVAGKSDDAHEGGDAKAPAKSKKLLLILVGVVLLLAIAGGGAFFYISKQRAAAEDTEDAPAANHASSKPHAPPVYLPLENMVVNLADPGGERVAQVGITLEVLDVKASEQVKAYLPTIRSAVLLLISQRTADELLSQNGKQQLAKDILNETLRPFGGGDDARQAQEKTKEKKTKKANADSHGDMPVVGVLFSSFIVQ